MDVVYILGTGSNWNNNELKASLRSVEKHLVGFDRVFLIGERPSWIQNVVHIPAKDRYGYKERNIMNKILTACNTAELSSDFFFLNDDIFLIDQVNAGSLPNYYQGTLSEKIDQHYGCSSYVKPLINTEDALKQASHGTKHFDIHTPIIYNKKAFRETMAAYDWKIPHGYVVKSLYGNTLGLEGEQLQDLKIGRPRFIEDIREMVEGKRFLSVGPSGLNSHMKNFLRERFPDKSRYEI